jgi:hypothetical protein
MARASSTMARISANVSSLSFAVGSGGILNQQ